MENRLRKPFIFIVYQGFEAELAESLQHLLESWGYQAFQCRQGDRVGEAFRSELRENIRKSDLVIFLISREFRWSPYCQAEAGTAMALEKPCIPILIPPSEREEAGFTVAPVVEGIQPIRASDRNFISSLQSEIIKLLSRSKESMTKLIANLLYLQETQLSGFAIHDVKKEASNRDDVRAKIQTIHEDYLLSQPKQAISRVWSTLGDPDCRASIVGNVKKFLLGEEKTVVLTFIGVSLKYSLHLITDALQEVEESRADVSIPKKTLQIRLVHMHEQSHILHALKDHRDIESIRESFGKQWPVTKAKWKAWCGAEIEFMEPALYRIDYIPPRVGIMLEVGKESFLYAGRCAFKQTDPHLPIFNLDVGENEYLFYSKNASTVPNDANCKAIDEFKASFNAYREVRNNTRDYTNMGVRHVDRSTSTVFRSVEKSDGSHVYQRNCDCIRTAHR